MAHISASMEQSILQINNFLGLNENPDGDTGIKVGELSKMRNFRVTPDGHLQIRPGQKTIIDLKKSWDELESKPSDVTKPILCGVWSGLIAGKEHVLAAYGGVLWDVSMTGAAPREVGRATQDDTHFFGFSNKVYHLNGHEYMSWDGGEKTSFTMVEGYIPTVMTATPPNGAGLKLENVNRLTGKRKVKFSPDGESTVFKLPEKDIDRIDSVSGEGVDQRFVLNAKEGTVTFPIPIPAGTNSMSIVYQKRNESRGQVERMHYSELFNGETDSRVFLYGDGSSKTIYSGNDLDKSTPTAEYFPDLFEASVGDANSPLTGLIRHYGRLLAFKQDSAWSIDLSVVSVPGGGVLTTFPVTPVNRSIGNEAMGQVKLLENNPISFTKSGAYQWKASGVTADHRNADRISDRVRDTFSEFDLSKIKTFNRIREGEFWILYAGKALILNYSTNTWYLYTNMDFGGMAEVDGQLYGFCVDGKIVHISRKYRNDDLTDIDCYAETGSMAFDREWMLKYSPALYVALKPEIGARVYVTVETNRRSDYPDKIVSSGFATFSRVDFRHWSFGTNRKPQVRRVKMKVKKATFYKLVFFSKSSSATATVLSTDIQVRYAGKVK